jgi:hypothetical protein
MAKITIDDNTYYSTAKSDINFDNDPPVISSMVPTDSATISGFKPVVSVSFYDSGSGIDKSKVSMSLNGQDVTQSTEIMSQGIRYALPDDLTPGKYTVHLNITDKAGNTTSRDWTFGVTGSTATSMFTHDGDATLRPGQPVNFSLRAVPGSQVSVQIGGMPPFPLTETSPGVFSGIYTIRDRDHFGGDIVTATILPPNAEQYTIQSLQRMGVSGNISPESMAPVISSPLASQTLTDDPLIIGGSAPAASTVEIHVTYSTALNAHTSINSAIADITVVADTAGNFQTKPLHIPRLRGSMPMVTITATTVLPDGTRSPNTMLVLHGGR